MLKNFFLEYANLNLRENPRSLLYLVSAITCRDEKVGGIEPGYVRYYRSSAAIMKIWWRVLKDLRLTMLPLAGLYSTALILEPFLQSLVIIRLCPGRITRYCWLSRKREIRFWLQVHLAGGRFWPICLIRPPTGAVILCFGISMPISG